MKKDLHPKRILFLQLPLLDNDTGGIRENFHMAGFYLFHGLAGSRRPFNYEARFLRPEEECADDAHLLQTVLAWQPQIVACTLYLWNVERTLHLLQKLRPHLPDAKFVMGGPEVAARHPFLLRSRLADVIVAGEGEGVFPEIVSALETNVSTDFDQVAWKQGRRYVWGNKRAPTPVLRQSLPLPDAYQWRPNENGLAYLETGRGCPLRCSYCRYSRSRRRPGFLTPPEVEKRVRILVERGAREIRFVDPMLNANPYFDEVLAILKKLNRSGRLEFFGELQADRLSSKQITLLAQAGFSDVEVGIQSRNPEVLRRIGRPCNMKSLDKNLRTLTRQGIEVTVDLMYGLPGQSRDDVMASLEWAAGFERAYVQCLQTLLLPGTELRRNRRRLGLVADQRPPYGIRSTCCLSWDDIREIEDHISRDGPVDCMTETFVGYRLADLFDEKVTLLPEQSSPPGQIPGSSSRRALVFRGGDLFAHRRAILATVRQALTAEPHALWQFVLNPEREEPLDLINEIITEIRSYPSLWLDRFASVATWDRIASRRVFVRLRQGRRYSPAWVEAASALLETHFY